MWVELRLPEEVAAGLPPAEEADRGQSDVTVALEVVGAVSNVVTVAQVIGAAPELARRIRSWLRSKPSGNDSRDDASPRLVIKGPGVHVELDLPPNVPSERIVTALVTALQPEQTDEESADREGR